MSVQPATKRIYSPAERWSDAFIHALGIVAALVAVPILITLSAFWSGKATIVAAASIYGACLLALFIASAVNNMVTSPAWNEVLRRVDRAAIYFKIAGTYTPLAVLTSGQFGFVLASIWAAALAGVSLVIVSPDRAKWLALALYLGLGWAGAFIGGPLISELTTAGLSLIIVGGSLYTVGVGFFLWKRLPFHNTIWHVLVLAASFVFYAAILVELADRARAF
jgi:hemolysin III